MPFCIHVCLMPKSFCDPQGQAPFTSPFPPFPSLRSCLYVTVSFPPVVPYLSHSFLPLFFLSPAQTMLYSPDTSLNHVHIPQSISTPTSYCPLSTFNFPEPSRVYILSLSLHLPLDASDPHLHICLPATTPHIIEICRVLLVFCKQGLKWASSAQAASLLSTITGWTTSLYCLQQYVVLLCLSKSFKILFC